VFPRMQSAKTHDHRQRAVSGSGVTSQYGPTRTST
jgi:hypothetical protein